MTTASLPVVRTRVAPQPAGRAARRIRTAGTALAATTAALVVGGLSSYGQTVLPGVLAPLANSAAGYTLLAGLLLAAVVFGGERRSPVLAIVLGPIVFVALVAGYALVSTSRGYPYVGLEWMLLGLLAGPVIGASVAGLRSSRSLRVAAGAGVLVGVLLHDAVRGLVALPETDPAGWIVLGAVGVALAVVVSLVRLRAAVPALVLVAVAGVTAGGLGIALGVLSGALFV